MAVAAEAVVQIVGGDEEHVELLLFAGIERRTKSEQRDNCDKADALHGSSSGLRLANRKRHQYRTRRVGFKAIPSTNRKQEMACPLAAACGTTARGPSRSHAT